MARVYLVTRLRSFSVLPLINIHQGCFVVFLFSCSYCKWCHHMTCTGSGFTFLKTIFINMQKVKSLISECQIAFQSDSLSGFPSANRDDSLDSHVLHHLNCWILIDSKRKKSPWRTRGGRKFVFLGFSEAGHQAQLLTSLNITMHFGKLNIFYLTFQPYSLYSTSSKMWKVYR